MSPAAAVVVVVVVALTTDPTVDQRSRRTELQQTLPRLPLHTLTKLSVNYFSVAHVLEVEAPRLETLSTARIACRQLR